MAYVNGMAVGFIAGIIRGTDNKTTFVRLATHVDGHPAIIPVYVMQADEEKLEAKISELQIGTKVIAHYAHQTAPDALICSCLTSLRRLPDAAMPADIRALMAA